MNLDFDLEQVVDTEFGVGVWVDDTRQFFVVPIEDTLKDVLVAMGIATATGLEGTATNQPRFEPGEKYANSEYLVLPIADEFVEPLSALHMADNLALSDSGLDRLRSSFCYFARFRDSADRRLTAVRRSSQFKATIGKRNRLMELIDNTLRRVEGPILQLNSDWDLLIDSDYVHIAHPASFITLGQIDAALQEAIPRNVENIRHDLRYVDWTNIEEYALEHPRAAGLLASIQSQGFSDNLDRSALVRLCEDTDVNVQESGGVLSVDDRDVLGFLEVIDRRRYPIELVPGQPEQYRASSRSRLSGNN